MPSSNAIPSAIKREGRLPTPPLLPPSVPRVAPDTPAQCLVDVLAYVDKYLTSAGSYSSAVTAWRAWASWYRQHPMKGRSACLAGLHGAWHLILDRKRLGRLEVEEAVDEALFDTEHAQDLFLRIDGWLRMTDTELDAQEAQDAPNATDTPQALDDEDAAVLP